MPAVPDFSLGFSRALGWVVVDIHGALDARTAPHLKDRLVDVIDGQGNRQLVLELRGMTRIDATGFSAFLDAQRRMRKIGGQLVLSGPSSDVVHAFERAGLDLVFTITPAWTHPARGTARSNRNSPAGWGRQA